MNDYRQIIYRLSTESQPIELNKPIQMSLEKYKINISRTNCDDIEII